MINQQRIAKIDSQNRITLTEEELRILGSEEYIVAYDKNQAVILPFHEDKILETLNTKEQKITSELRSKYIHHIVEEYNTKHGLKLSVG